MTRLDWEKAKRTRVADHPSHQSYPIAWERGNPKYESRCIQCGGPILPGPAWQRKVNGKYQYMHIGHSTT